MCLTPIASGVLVYAAAFCVLIALVIVWTKDLWDD